MTFDDRASTRSPSPVTLDAFVGFNLDGKRRDTVRVGKKTANVSPCIWDKPTSGSLPPRPSRTRSQARPRMRARAALVVS